MGCNKLASGKELFITKKKVCVGLATIMEVDWDYLIVSLVIY
jgi:hypothetical protein